MLKDHKKYSIMRVLGILIGISLLIYGFINIQKSLSTNTWSSTTGTVSQSEMKGLKKSRKFHLAVSYSASGSSYVCERYGFGNSPQKLEADQYPLHAKVPIYYDPNQPHECVIKRGLSLANVMLAGAGLLFFVIGIDSHRKLKKLS